MSGTELPVLAPEAHEADSLKVSRVTETVLQSSTIPRLVLCPRCLDIFSQPISRYQDRVRFVFSFEQFVETAKYCQVCAALYKHDLCKPTTHSWSLCYDEARRMVVLYSHVWDGVPRVDLRHQLLEFLPAAQKDGLPAVELFEEDHQLRRSVVPIRPENTVRNTSDEASFEQIRAWLRECETSHQLCRKDYKRLAGPSFLPTRLIDIRERPRVVNSNQIVSENRPVRYATLSHRWLPHSVAKLLCSNIDAYKTQIDSSGLIPVFSDSIMMAKRLGLDFIWIDALCIIQDDAEDWRREASLMGLVYANAFYNFGASAAAESEFEQKSCTAHSQCADRGLFSCRSPSDFPIICTHFSWEGTDRLYYGFPYFVKAFLDNTPLLKRGWVFQERLLSPRSIYFGKQLTWECPQLLASQIFPHGSPGSLSPKSWNSNAPVRLQNLVLQRSFQKLVYACNIRIDELYNIWLSLVSTYKTCRLSYESDMFPALSGLAKRFQIQLQDEYLAGLWRKDMIRGLLWHVFDWPRGTSERPQNPAYKSPSWSWASPSAHYIAWDLVENNHYTEEDMLLAEVHDAAVTMASDDPTGPVTDGFVQISGYICANSKAIASRCQFAWPSNLMESYDNGWDNGDQPREMQTRNCKGSLFLVLTWRPAVASTPPKIRGLILEPTGRNPDEYRRIGAFKMFPDERPEFKDFDPYNFKRQTVTII